MLQVVAEDRDLGSNGDVEYLIYGGESTQASEYFQIQTDSGQITLKKTLEGLGKTIDGN